MPKHGKKYSAVRETAPAEEVSIEDAIVFLKSNATASFDESMEMGLRMGIDPRKSDNAIRASVALPHGTGKAINIIVFAEGAAADAAKEAGANEVGSDDLIEKVKAGWTDFDVAIATPDAMKEVRKLGRVLGPRGLMPNPKTGTVTDDTAAAVKQALAGKVDFRMDRHGNINVPFGKVSFEADALKENAEAVIEAIRGAKPTGAKGIYIKNVTFSTTMGVGLRTTIRD